MTIGATALNTTIRLAHAGYPSKVSTGGHRTPPISFSH
jgi:hypothetical protein